MKLSCWDDDRIYLKVMDTYRDEVRVEISLEDGRVRVEILRPDHAQIPLVDHVMMFIMNNIKALDLVSYYYVYEFDSGEEMSDGIVRLLEADAGITDDKQQANPELARDFKRFKEEGLSESLEYKMFKREG